MPDRTVAAGTTVTWINRDDVPHRIFLGTLTQAVVMVTASLVGGRFSDRTGRRKVFVLTASIVCDASGNAAVVPRALGLYRKPTDTIDTNATHAAMVERTLAHAARPAPDGMTEHGVRVADGPRHVLVGRAEHRRHADAESRLFVIENQDVLLPTGQRRFRSCVA